jgi:hypothetical protein
MRIRDQDLRSGLGGALDMGRLTAWKFMFYGPRDELGGRKNNVALFNCKNVGIKRHELMYILLPHYVYVKIQALTFVICKCFFD